MSLQTWADAGWVKAQPPRRQEIAQLLAASDRDLVDATVAGLSASWRFSIAYSSILQAAAAALAAAGYRASRDLHHHRVLQSLRLTIGVDAALAERLDAYRRKRHKSVYESITAVSDHEAGEILASARDLRARIDAWLKAHHADLMRSDPA